MWDQNDKKEVGRSPIKDDRRKMPKRIFQNRPAIEDQEKYGWAVLRRNRQMAEVRREWKRCVVKEALHGCSSTENDVDTIWQDEL